MADRSTWRIRVTENVYMTVAEAVQINLLAPRATRQALHVESLRRGIPVNLILNDLLRTRYPDTYPDADAPTCT
jgi:hypothetical protein